MNRDLQNSEDYLKKRTQNEDGFSVPENYFDGVEDNVLSKMTDKDFPKDIAFITPDTYFNTFDEKLFAKIDFPKKEAKVISLKSRILKLIPAAAAASILLFIGLNYSSTNEEISFETISSEELELWFIDSNSEEGSRDLLEFVDADFTENDIIEDDTSINDDDILEYLNTINNASLLTEIES
jgi:hypothetical protein